VVVDGPLGMLTPGAEIWTSAETPPPPPGVSVERGDACSGCSRSRCLPNWLPKAVAASVAAVERSPATAVNEAWNCPSWKPATLADELGRLLVDGRTSYCGLGESGSDRRPKSRVSSFRNRIRSAASEASVPARCRVVASMVRDRNLERPERGIGSKLTYRLVGKGGFRHPAHP